MGDAGWPKRACSEQDVLKIGAINELLNGVFPPDCAFMINSGVVLIYA